MEDTPFTQGIVNKDGLLPYHFDKTNFRHVWSGMVAFRHNMRGGHLAVPEYDVGFEIADRSLLLFDGQSLFHGVTPMEPTGLDAYRYSIVYYSREAMVKCLPPGEEVKRQRRKR
jgi:hypothetical protein